MEIVVSFDTQDQGRRVVGGPPNLPAKIVFVVREHVGPRPRPGETWVCAFLRDTQPGSRKGAHLVRPLRPTIWRWQAVGEPVDGLHREVPVCEFEAVGAAHAPEAFGPAAERARNAAYEAALRRRARFQAGPIDGPRFREEFGPPSAVLPSSHATLELVWEGLGVRRVGFAAAGAALGWTCTWTGAWTRDGESLRCEQTFEERPDLRTWATVGEVLGGLPRFLEGASEGLPAALRATIVQTLRTALPEPAACARADFDAARGAFVDALQEPRALLRGLRGPGVPQLVSFFAQKEIYDTPSPDRWPTYGVVTRFEEVWELHMAYDPLAPERRDLGRLTAHEWRLRDRIPRRAFVMTCRTPPPDATPEAVRAAELDDATAWRAREVARLRDAWRDRVLTGAFEDDRWNEVYRATWAALVADLEAALDRDDAALLARAEAEAAEYVATAKAVEHLRAEETAALDAARVHAVRLVLPTRTWHAALGDDPLDAVAAEHAELQGRVAGVRFRVAEVQAAREQAAREQAAREQVAREQVAREQVAREQVAREPSRPSEAPSATLELLRQRWGKPRAGR